MKNQTNKILVSLFIVGFVTLNISYSADARQNNRSNSARNASNKNFVRSEQTAPLICEDTPGRILREINNSPEPLKKQFRDGTITYSYAEKKLVFAGYVHGNGNNIRSLINGFDKLRDAQCLRVVSFEGKTAGSNFEWRADADIQTLDPKDSCAVGSVVEKVFGDQLKENLSYTYDRSSKILELRGHIGDAPGRGRFNSLIAQLQRFMKNGCLIKIVFAPGADAKANTSAQIKEFIEDGCVTKSAFSITRIAFVPKIKAIETLLLKDGFEWQICEPPSGCECLGQCQPCPC